MQDSKRHVMSVIKRHIEQLHFDGSNLVFTQENEDYACMMWLKEQDNTEQSWYEQMETGDLPEPSDYTDPVKDGGPNTMPF